MERSVDVDAAVEPAAESMERGDTLCIDTCICRKEPGDDYPGLWNCILLWCWTPCTLLFKVLSFTPLMSEESFARYSCGTSHLLDRWEKRYAQLKQQHPKWFWHLWFAFFTVDWCTDIYFVSVELGNARADLREQGLNPDAMFAAAILSIVVTAAVLCLRLFKLRPLMSQIGFSYETPEAIQSQDGVAKKALWWERRLGGATTFGEDMVQAGLTLTVAIATGNTTFALTFNLVTSIGMSLYVVYEALFKHLWDPQVECLLPSLWLAASCDAM